METELAERQRALSAIEQERIQATNDKKALEQESGGVKKDIQDAEMNIQKIEQEKTNRDHVIKSLNDEIAYQDEIINKLNKEKKHITENSSKSVEDLQTVDDKVQHLHKVKEKLECTLDELEASAEKEKRTRAAVEKERRKLELDLKLLQETVADLERSRKELEAMIGRKEVDVSAMRTKLNDEQSLVGKVSKKSTQNAQLISILAGSEVNQGASVSYRGVRGGAGGRETSEGPCGEAEVRPGQRDGELGREAQSGDIVR